MRSNEMIVKSANQITRKEFLEYVYTIDPLVHAVFQQWRSGDCTFEQACQQAVIALVAEKNSHLAEIMAENFNKQPILVNSQTRIEIFLFANEMEKIMAENDKVRGDSWKTMRVEDLIQLQFMQVNRFEKQTEIISIEDHKKMRKNLLNMANYCMILWHRLGEK